MIEVRGLSKRFGRKTVLKGINFEVNSGKVAVLGYNGAGKSTLAKIIAGILKPTQGEVRVFGKDPSTSPDARKRIGIATHNPMLYGELTVGQNLKFYAKIYGKERKIEELADRFGFSDYLDAKVNELSRGYLQRVSLAKAIINDPDLLILDEITSGLDLAVRRKVLDVAESFNGTLLFTTHNLEEAKICDTFIVLRNGKLLYNGNSFEEAVEALNEVS
ncbi:MAG: ABC transporter ATP-binding protein [Archaeoglobus sp.]|uniref:ABC transporter ATP-binding protein n=1 Tax=Archaeoglobus sp. TaxID=1872626 RepID=UPI001D3D2AC3|nr:ABC transporter ATP-binding protein [Archaeoglobus sp.]MBO8179164.1 ABC transporter ATP-binding protein [Archaeoglobus sp.]